MKKIKYVVVWALIASWITMLFSGCSADVETIAEKPKGINSKNASDSLIQVAGDDEFSLWLNPKTCEMSVKKQDVLYTVVQDELNAEEQGAVAVKLQSHLLVSYINDSNATFEAVSKISCIGRGTYKYEKVSNGIRIIFDFSRDREQFVIPVDFILDNGELIAKICSEDIIEYGTSRIFSISLLPGFFYGQPDQEGEFFLPDGSGSLMDFTLYNDKVSTVKLEVYGRDLALSTAKVSTNAQICRLPVYGVIKNRNSVLSVIEEGDSLAKVVVNPAKNSVPVANVYAEFRYRALDTVVLADQSFKATSTTISAQKPEKTSYSVRYMFLNGNSKYDGLAFKYREYLGGKSNADSRRIYIDTYGAVKKKTSTIGIVYDKLYKVTDFDDLSKMSDVFKNCGGVSVTYLLNGFHAGGYGNGLTVSADISGVTGGKKALKTFKESLNSGDRIYLGGEFFCDEKQNIFSNYACNLYNQVISRRYYSKALLIEEKELAQPFVKHSKSLTIFNSYIKSAEKLPIDGFVFNDIGNELYGDFDRKNDIGRNTAAGMQIEMLANLNNGMKVVNGANAYTFGSITESINTPVESSKYIFETRSVPFIQIALSGVVNMVSEPLNMQSDIESSFIKNIALGMGIQFRLTGEENNEFKNTKLKFLYNSSFYEWEKTVEEYAIRFAQISEKIGNSIIEDLESPKEGI